MPKRGGQDIWAWITPPLNARYVGVIYLAALVALLVFAVHGRWNPGRLVLWEIFVFTTAIMVVMLAYAGRFEWARVATWVFWPLYVFLPVNSAVFLWRLRDWRGAGAPLPPPRAPPPPPPPLLGPRPPPPAGPGGGAHLLPPAGGALPAPP